MVINDLEAFPENLKTMISHVRGSAEYARTSLPVRHASIVTVQRLFDQVYKNFEPFTCETAAVLGQTLLSALDAEISKNNASLKKAFSDKTCEDRETVWNLLTENFKRLEKRYAGFSLSCGVISSLRERYDPDLLKSTGQTYKGLVSCWESPKDSAPEKSAPILHV